MDYRGNKLHGLLMMLYPDWVHLKTSPECVHDPCQGECTVEASFKSFVQLLLEQCVGFWN